MRAVRGGGAVALLPLLAGSVAASPHQGNVAASTAPLLETRSRNFFVIEGQARQGGVVRGQALTGAVLIALDGQPVLLAGDGRFLLGFDRDQNVRAILVATLSDGRTVGQALFVSPRTWLNFDQPTRFARRARWPATRII